MSSYDAVVFDSDGVLVELTPMAVLRDAVRAAFADVGVEDPDPRLVDLAADHEDLDALAAVESEYGVELDEFWPARERRAIESQCELLRGAGKPPYSDLRRIAELDAALGVVSNNQQATVERVVVEYGLRDVVETVYGRDPTVAGARRRKPDTYLLEAALDDLGTRNALYVGDSESDVVVAQRAGVDSAFLRRPHRADTRLTVDPTYEFESLAALVDGLQA